MSARNAGQRDRQILRAKALPATLSGWSSCSSFARRARRKWEFLSQFLELKGGPPSLSVNRTRSVLHSASANALQGFSAGFAAVATRLEAMFRHLSRPQEAQPDPTVCESAFEVPNPGDRIGNRSSESLSSGLRGRSSCHADAAQPNRKCTRNDHRIRSGKFDRIPFSGFLVATERFGERAKALLPGTHAISDTRHQMNHCRLSPDERQLFGGAVSTKLFNPPEIERLLRKNFLQVFPLLSDVKSRNFRFGALGIAVGGTPRSGGLQDRLLFAQGYFGPGLALPGKGGAMAARKIWSKVLNSTSWRGSRPWRRPERAA